MTLLLLCMLTALAAPQEPVAGKPERFSAVLTAGPVSQTPLPVEIAINTWGTSEARERLAAAFASGGQPALLAALRKEGAAGYVLASNRDRLVAGYIEQERRPDGGRRILLLCVRDGGSWEFARDSGWTDHLFRIVALTLDAQDHGGGMLFHMAKVKVTKETGVDLLSELSGQATRLLSLQKTR